MQSKLLIPLQSMGIGDVIYQQTLIHEFIEQGYKILWPVESHYAEGLNRAYPKINFIDKTLVTVNFNEKRDVEKDGVRILPLRWADVILKVPPKDCMKAKYKLYNLNWEIWKEKACWKRDINREKNLYEKLGLSLNEPYNLINKNYAINEKATINLKNGNRNIEMKQYKDYSLFDWAYVIENAAEIHTVSTSVLFILELLDLEQPIHLYPRANDPVYEHVAYLFTKPYILH